MALASPVLLGFAKGIQPVGEVEVCDPAPFVSVRVVLDDVGIHIWIMHFCSLSPELPFNQLLVLHEQLMVNQRYKIYVEVCKDGSERDKKAKG